MKINLPVIKSSPSQTTDAPYNTATGKAQHAGAPVPNPGSSVALSSTARQLAQLSNTDHDINLVRVSEIRTALEEGTLKINADRIADSLISSARDLLTKK